MKCDSCKKDVKETYSLYEEQYYNENHLTKRALNKLIRKGILWLCEKCNAKVKEK